MKLGLLLLRNKYCEKVETDFAARLFSQSLQGFKNNMKFETT